MAPDPVESRGSVTYEHAGIHTGPGASFQMRLVTYLMRFADLVVTVEGWRARNHPHVGNIGSVMLPDGKQVFAGSS